MWIKRLKNFLNIRIITGTLTSSVMILGIAWFIADQDYEPAITALVGIIGFISLFKYSFLSFDKNLTADRIALVVGNQDYPYAPLQNVTKDVDAVCLSLKAKGFKIIKRVNPHSQDLIKAIYDFQTILSTGGVGVFYYAGHAAQIDGRDMILPVDREMRTKEEILMHGIDLNELLGPVDKIIEDSPSHNGSLVIYSTGSGGVAIDSTPEFKDGSPFAVCFLELADKWNLEVFDLFRLLCQSMSRLTKGLQIPWLSASLDTEFYFKPIVKERIGILKILVFDACRNNPFYRTSIAYEYVRAQDTEPNGGPATRSGNSCVRERPPVLS